MTITNSTTISQYPDIMGLKTKMNNKTNTRIQIKKHPLLDKIPAENNYDPNVTGLLIIVTAIGILLKNS